MVAVLDLCDDEDQVYLDSYWNGLMFLDVLQKGYLSESQGYTGLILWLGGGKRSLSARRLGCLSTFSDCHRSIEEQIKGVV
ncbi:hypothetical protein [Pseudoalteromonas rubra]|uniref:hypothetical protein n=1 Tax=Pseudoalteromonas rubra TaxID=43658 RepID=UPI000F7B7763|nr:hypothetical protein [Pseudoalteromonas rubra]